MRQSSLNALLEGVTHYYRTIDSSRKKEGMFGAYSFADYRQAEAYLSTLDSLLEMPEKTRRVALRKEMSALKTGIAYAWHENKHIMPALEDVTKQQYLIALNHIEYSIQPKPIRPAA